MRATSRWLVKRILPSLAKRKRMRISASPLSDRARRRSSSGPGAETAPDGAVDRNRTGTWPPVERSCPVPWLPPAGGTAEATTCSIPNPVQAPQS